MFKKTHINLYPVHPFKVINTSGCQFFKHFMEARDFANQARPRDLFVYTCSRIAEPLAHLGFVYRKSRNDLCKKVAGWQYCVYFQPSVKFSSVCFTVHIHILAQKLLERRAICEKARPSDLVYSATLAEIAGKASGWPMYNVASMMERERVIKEITGQIMHSALPFFARFQDLTALRDELRNQGIFPGRKRDRCAEKRLLEKIDYLLAKD